MILEIYLLGCLVAFISAILINKYYENGFFKPVSMIAFSSYSWIAIVVIMIFLAVKSTHKEQK